jgi:hypothetical protein
LGVSERSEFPNRKPFEVFDALKYILVIRSLTHSLPIKRSRPSRAFKIFVGSAFFGFPFMAVKKGNWRLGQSPI